MILTTTTVELECRLSWAMAALRYMADRDACYWAGEVRRLSRALTAGYRYRLVGASHTARMLSAASAAEGKTDSLCMVDRVGSSRR